MNEQVERIETELVESPSAIEAVERAQIDVQISTARKYPRSWAKVKTEMMSMATMDIETAESCFYNLPRGGKSIPGPSIRLAEIALSCFGNVRAATRIIGTHLGDDPHVVIQAVCHDLEKNSAVCVEKRRRITKKKSKDRPDEDDVNLATNACTAIALRDAIFKIVPGVLVKPVYDAAKRVAIGDDKTLVDRRARAIESLAKMGITPDRICQTLEIKNVEEINLEHLETLTGMRNAIKDGQTTIDQAFPPVVKAPVAGIFGAAAAQTASEPVKAAAQQPAEPKAPKAKPEPKPAAPDAPTTPPATSLETDKTRLAAWMLQNAITWPMMQPIVQEEIGKWADEIATFEDLSLNQAKAIWMARAGIAGALGKTIL